MSQHSFSAYDSALLSDEGDLYSDDDDASTAYGEIRTNSLGEKIIPSAADRRAHHNALERKRRDHIKDSFTSLRDSVPSLQGEKASRAQILKKAAEYIQYMRKKNNNVQSDIDEIAKQNKMLEDQIRRMEKQKSGGGGGGMTNQALSSLFSASEVSTSYDISENSNGSSNSGLGGSSSLVAGGSPMAVAANASSSNGSSSSTAASAVSTAAVSIIKSNATALGNGNALKRQCVQAPNGTSGSLINGTVATVRTVTVKNGGTIIVQNPQHNKTLNNTPHVIYVTTTSGGAAKANGTNSPTTTTTTPSLACNLSL